MVAAHHGADDFYALSRRLKAAGATELRKELAKGLKDATKPLIAETRAAAKKDLPKRGGLAARMAKKPQQVRVRTGAKTAGVSIVFPKVQRGITTGNLRHPVFGQKGVYVFQKVNATWWDDTLEKGAPTVQPHLLTAIENATRKLEGG